MLRSCALPISNQGPWPYFSQKPADPACLCLDISRGEVIPATVFPLGLDVFCFGFGAVVLT